MRSTTAGSGVTQPTMICAIAAIALGLSGSTSTVCVPRRQAVAPRGRLGVLILDLQEPGHRLLLQPLAGVPLGRAGPPRQLGLVAGPSAASER